MKKILIINPFGIGDCLFLTPVIRFLKQAYPECRISFWCNERVESLLKNNPDIVKTYALNRGDLKKIFRKSVFKGISRLIGLIRKLKSERFDLAFDFSLDHRYGFISKLAGIKQRFGYDYKGRGRFLTQKLELKNYSGKHVIEYYSGLLSLCGLAPENLVMKFIVPPAVHDAACEMLIKNGVKVQRVLIGIFPGGGASWGVDAARKHWPGEYFGELCDRLIENTGSQIVILGDRSEATIADAFKRQMRNKVIDLSGKTTLEELSGVISCLDIVVANDGGPLHMAVALGKKTVSFFGPVDSKSYGPYPSDSNKHIVLTKNLPCAPCYQDFRLKECKLHMKCLIDISVQEAFDAVRRLL